MKLIAMFTVLVGLMFARPASAQGVWDNKGWVKLGEREVNGRFDKDTIEVGRYEGKFTKLTMVVEKSDLELLSFEVTFGNNEKWDANVRQVFKEGTRTRVIDLPGDDRVIKSINLKYKNLPGGGKAKVEVWGWKDANAGERGGGMKKFSWDSNGWQMLGERQVNGRMDKDRITVGRYQGKFSKMTIVVLDSDLELLDLEVKFGKGPPWNPGVRQVFNEGTRTRVIDFPGDERSIKFIDLKYKNLPGGGKAKVQVWAK